MTKLEEMMNKYKKPEDVTSIKDFVNDLRNSTNEMEKKAINILLMDTCPGERTNFERITKLIIYGLIDIVVKQQKQIDKLTELVIK